VVQTGSVQLDGNKNYSFLVSSSSGTPSIDPGVVVSATSANAPDFYSYLQTDSNHSLTLSTDGSGNVYLNASVPEPGTILGLSVAGMGLAGWVRRRRAK